MDEIKSKVLKFVKKQTLIQSYSENTSPTVANVDINTDFTFPKREAREVTEDSEEGVLIEDDTILEEIDKVYFDVDDLDIMRYQLNQLPQVLSCTEMKRNLKLLYRQHSVVSKRVLQMILEQESTCKKEFDEILKIQQEVGVALTMCQNSRSLLQNATKDFTVSSLGILASYNRKNLIYELIKSLKTLRTLQKTDHRLQELLQEENFPGAISLLQECLLVASNFNHFKCVAELTSKLNDTLYLTKEQLDVALSRICKKFNLETYSKLQEAYRLLDDTETVMDQLLMHFTSEIHSTVFNRVHEMSTHDNNYKRQFQQLCESVSNCNFIPCLQTLCQSLWHIINSYYQIVQWHQNYNKQLTKTGIPSKDVKISLSKQHIKQKLENGLSRLWNDVQSKICVYIFSHDFADYKFEELLQILGMIHKLIEIGEEFCGSKSEDLQNSIRKQSVRYFKNYHRSKLEELKIFLENESWTMCPVRPKFTLLHLQEFRTLRTSVEHYRNLKPDKNDILNPQNTSTISIDGSSTQNCSYFNKYQDGNDTPFDVITEEAIDDDFLSNIGDEISGYFTESSEDSENDELKKDFVEENPTQEIYISKKKSKPDQTSVKEKVPILSNTALTVLRQCGKYLQMCKLLKPISFDVITCMFQLFDYYLYNVYLFFAKDLPIQSSSMFSFKLQSTLKRIEENLIFDPTVVDVEDHGKVAPAVSHMLNLSLSENLYGLSERVVGVESLTFLGTQFEYIQSYILHLIPEQKRHFIQHIFTQAISCLSDMRRPAYMGVSAFVIDMKYLVREMSKVNFEVKEVMCEHSCYVDQILRELQVFSMRLNDVDIDIPVEVYNVLWENVIHIVNNTFIEGFSNIKKCSNEGRALMLLDYTQFLSKLEKITTLKPIPNREFVDVYVKAYYLQESNLEEWIKTHREYTPKQLEALVHCTCQNNKKRKQMLLGILENDK